MWVYQMNNKESILSHHVSDMEKELFKKINKESLELHEFLSALTGIMRFIDEKIILELGYKKTRSGIQKIFSSYEENGILLFENSSNQILKKKYKTYSYNLVKGAPKYVTFDYIEKKGIRIYYTRSGKLLKWNYYEKRPISDLENDLSLELYQIKLNDMNESKLNDIIYEYPTECYDTCIDNIKKYLISGLTKNPNKKTILQPIITHLNTMNEYIYTIPFRVYNNDSVSDNIKYLQDSEDVVCPFCHQYGGIDVLDYYEGTGNIPPASVEIYCCNCLMSAFLQIINNDFDPSIQEFEYTKEQAEFLLYDYFIENYSEDFEDDDDLIMETKDIGSQFEISVKNSTGFSKKIIFDKILGIRKKKYNEVI